MTDLPGHEGEVLQRLLVTWLQCYRGGELGVGLVQSLGRAQQHAVVVVKLGIGGLLCQRRLKERLGRAELLELQQGHCFDGEEPGVLRLRD